MSVIPDSSMSLVPGGSDGDLTPRERELGAIIDAYNEVTEQLKLAHERLGHEVVRLREELARKNQQLRRRERLAALGELAAGVAHEIRNPLGGIRLYASLLGKDVSDRPAALRTVEKIAQGVSRLESIVTAVLEFSRPARAEPGRVNVRALLREVVELASPAVERTGTLVETTVENTDVEMITDGAMLQRAMLNLVMNAIDAVYEREGEKRVWIGCRQAGDDEVVLTVGDNGPGIPADLMDRIFNPFFTTKGTGTGLGLSIVHQIVETLGGSVRASNGRDGGASFTVRLPVRMREVS